MKKKLRLKPLFVIILIFLQALFISNIFNKLITSSESRLHTAGVWVLTNGIHIDDLNPNLNWSKTAADNDWCNGSGTWSDPYLIENVTIDGISDSCIHIENSKVYFIIKNCTLVNIRVGGGYTSAIRLNNVNNGTFLKNNCSKNNGAGFYLGGCVNNTISNNTCNENTWNGILLDEGSNNNTIFGNNLNYNGFQIFKGHYNNVTENTITISENDGSSYWYKQIMVRGHNNSFSGNKFINCGFYLLPGEEPSFESLYNLSSNKIDQTNLINGKPVYFYAKKNFLTANNFSNSGQVILVGCNNSKISNLTISNGAIGISLYYSNNNTIFNNSLTFHFPYEILLMKSHQNNISDNILTNFGYSPGIRLYYNCDENLLKDNHIKDCTVGIEVTRSNYNNITENYLIRNGRGISVNGDNNTIKENHLLNNTDLGIGEWGNNNTYYLNRFFNNNDNAWDGGTDNYWDNGSIGNYWDDYIGNDTNDDGIGDTPYTVPGFPGNIDNFPIWDDGHNGSAILIDTRTSKDWSWASKHTWCSGSGTHSDPYIIKDCNINGYNNSFGIEILFSKAFFKIINCKVYNCTYYSGFGGGIRLVYVDNGTLINNNCSVNYCSGIYLSDCNNITIKKSILINNNYYSYDYIGNYAIKLYDSNNITIISNEIKGNYEAIYSSHGEYLKIINNTIEGNTHSSIRIGSDFSLVKNNTIFNNFQRGLIIDGNNITVSYNEIFNHQWGIDFSFGSDNTVANNSIHDNTYGIEVYGTESFTNCYYNTFYNNQFSNNYGFNALDNGAFNDWDKGGIGNYWHDYTGSDDDDDGIGEEPYLISGYANSQDNFPIWDDGHNGSKIMIDNLASNNWEWTKTRTWCSGSGTINDPYIIKNCIIDGNNLDTCIMIKNSNVYFIIENCVVFNSFTDGAGIELINVSNGIIINNNCSLNQGIGISIDDSSFNNMIYLNNISDNNLNAFDNGSGNLWDNGTIGNFWSDYSGKDENDDGIGDDPYSITGLAESYDNFPIWWDSPVFIIISPLLNEEFRESAPEYEVSIEEGVPDTMWYTLDGGITKIVFTYLTGTIEQTLWDNIPIGIVEIKFYINDSKSSISIKEVSVKKIEYYVLNPFVIDDTGTEDYTWIEVVNERWCSGSGTSSDPYTIEFVKINGQNSASCLTIRNSQIYFRISNSIFYNSGANQYDGGLKLVSVSNGEIIYNNCSRNNANGIVLINCQNIDITENTINQNMRNGILLINSTNINIANNKETINENELYGIRLDKSDNNRITGNIINYNTIGIYLNESNNNYIAENDLRYNNQPYKEIKSRGNTFENNQGIIQKPSFPFYILYIVLIVGIVIGGIIGTVVIFKKRISISGKKTKEISENKKAKVRRKLENKLNFVDQLINENKITLAYKNLGKVKDTADQYDFFDLFNKANNKVEICKEVEAGISKPGMVEEIITPKRKEKVKIEEELKPVKKKEEEIRYNIFISYSTIDRDYFQINKIVEELKKYPKINQVSYWERDSKANIVEFMDTTLEVSNTFILFCSENSISSQAVRDEWQAAFQMRKEGLIKLIPVYEEQKYIPKLLWHLLNVKYIKDDFKVFIENLYKEILR